ncbi:MAG: hypothetical protein GWN22_06615, partial [Gemmatimonadetes bacterium]|nr:hypothetical protein [Gemmatimonadota bacterium]
MGLMLLFDAAGSLAMWIALLVAIGLTVWEVREQQYPWRVQMWWITFVLLAHVPAYLGLRLWVAYRNSR